MKLPDDQENFLSYVVERVHADPENEVLRLSLASYLERLDRFEDALAHTERVLSSDNAPQARHIEGRCLAKLGRVDDARRVLRAALDASEFGSPTAQRIVDDLCSLPGGPGGTWKS